MREKGKKPKADQHIPARAPGPLGDPALALILGVFLFCLALLVMVGTFAPLEQRILGVDPVGYYVWFRSPAFDEDLQFENEYRTLNPDPGMWNNPGVNPDGERTATGHLGNAFSVGPAVLWSPFLVFGHVAARMSGATTDGFSQPYHAAVFIANLCYAAMGVVLTYGALRVWFERWPSALATLAAWACSPALYYTYAQMAVSHACSLFAVALLLFLWARLRERDALWGWALIGGAVGLATLVRWQNITFAAVPLVDLLWADRRRNLPKVAVCGAAGLAVFAPQMIGWKILYGSFLTIPQGGSFMEWSRPNIVKLVFSLEHGLITWTPLCGAGLVGVFLWPRHRRRVFVALAVSLAVQLYVGSCAGNVGWSFGMRRMVNCVPLFAVGFAHILTRLGNRLRWPAVVTACFAVWNLLFVLQYGGMLDSLYVQEALDKLAAEYNVPSAELMKMSHLPDGTPFDFGRFIEANRFPRDRAPTFRQFVGDKLTALFVIPRVLLAPVDRE